MKKMMNKKGFTIVELVIVIAVIAILAAVLIPTFSNVIEKANESKALQNVRNNYTQISMLSASNGDTLTDGTVFESDGFYFKLDKGQLVKVEESAVTDINKYTVLENDAKMYGENHMTVADKGVADKLANNNGTSITDFYQKDSYENIDKLITFYGTDINSLKIKDSSGVVIFDWVESESSKTRTSASLSMYFEKSNPDHDSAVKNKDCTTITTKEDAIGWYSYEILDDSTTVKGYFYYE